MVAALGAQPGIPAAALPWLRYGAAVAACTAGDAEAFVDMALSAFDRQVRLCLRQPLSASG